MASFYIYILKCADGTLYVGRTNNPDRRIRQHNGELKGGAKYTRSRRPVVIKYMEKHATLSNTLKRELELKGLDHKEKLLLIKTSNKKLT